MSQHVSHDKNSRSSWLARYRGGIALSVSTLGFAVSELVYGMHWLPPIPGQLCVTAFEGALVGSIADWFAVTALFKRIPIPLVSRHTGLIAKRREALSRGIVEMVEREWLSPHALRTHLEKFSFAELITRRLTSEEGKIALHRFTRKQASKALKWLNDPRCIEIIDTVIHRIVKRINTGQQLAPMLHRLAKDPYLLDRLWHGAIEVLERVLKDPHLLSVLSDILLDQLDSLSNEGRWKSVKVWIGKQFLDGEDDREKVERLLTRLLNSAQQQLVEIENDREHPLRLRMRALLVISARHLQYNRDSRLAQVLERSKWQLYDTFEQQQGSRTWIAFFQRWTEEQLSKENSTLNHYINTASDYLIQSQFVEAEKRLRFDAKVRQWAGQLIDEHPGAVGDIVRESLSETKMPTSRLVSTIEERVGPDLQWIRVNGAVVGGAAALVIGLVRAGIQLWL